MCLIPTGQIWAASLDSRRAACHEAIKGNFEFVSEIVIIASAVAGMVDVCLISKVKSELSALTAYVQKKMK